MTGEFRVNSGLWNTSRVGTATPGWTTTYQRSGNSTDSSRSPTPSAHAEEPRMKTGTSAPSGNAIRASSSIERPVGPPGVSAENDLVVRAARTLQRQTATPLGASLRVTKRIPLGGGLGGGSSDAATTLLALNQLWGCGLSMDDLMAMGLPLGADVPVFVRGSSAWAEGVGERISPVELPDRWFVIIHPGVAVATRDVFQASELTRNSPVITIRAFFESGGRNDCEGVVRAKYAEVADALDWLSRYGDARLTGTGSCIFAACASAIDAERIAARVPDRWTSFVARGMNLSPAHERL